MNHVPSHHVETFAGRITAATGVKVSDCYQCGKCTAGCPMASEMDYTPSLMMRMLQTDEDNNIEALLRSKTIWLCLSCETCRTRCPQMVNITAVTDFLRQESIRQKKSNPESKKIIAFHRSFLDSIKSTGRLYEVGLIVRYKMRTFDLFQDVLTAPVLYLKGKLSILPHSVKDKKGIRNIFKQTTGEVKK